MSQLILAGIFDCLAGIRWMLSGGAGAAPKSVINTLLGVEDSEPGDVVSFATADEWEAERHRILGEE